MAHIDYVIKVLLESRTNSNFVEINLPQDLLVRVVSEATELLMSQPMLLELNAPMNICGDIHGQYPDLLTIFTKCGLPPATNYLFLGDYVDRAHRSIECIMLLLCLKLKFPGRIFLLRGNHETASLNRVYGFFDECKRRYTVKLWRTFVDCFNCMPIAALVEDKIFCTHGGLSPSLTDFADINQIRRPLDVPPEGLMCDLLWSDPVQSDIEWTPSARGVSYNFNETVIRDFLDKFGIDLVCRGHQVVEDGYEFYADRGLVTIFSAPNYCGEFDNAAGVLVVSEDLVCSFQIFRPEWHRYQKPAPQISIEDVQVGMELASSVSDEKNI